MHAFPTRVSPAETLHSSWIINICLPKSHLVTSRVRTGGKPLFSALLQFQTLTKPTVVNWGLPQLSWTDALWLDTTTPPAVMAAMFSVINCPLATLLWRSLLSAIKVVSKPVCVPYKLFYFFPEPNLKFLSLVRMTCFKRLLGSTSGIQSDPFKSPG